MSRSILALLLVSLAATVSAADESALAQLRSRLPVPGTVLGEHEEATTLVPILAEGATAERIAPGPGVPATQALRVRVPKAYPQVYAVQVSAPCSAAAIHTGDVVVVGCWLRAPDAIGGASGTASFRLQMNRDPWLSPVDGSASCGREWKAVFASGVSPQDYPAGIMELSLHLGQQAQVIDLAGVVAINLGPGIDLTKLPTTAISWPGMEANAPWRAEAKRRIERYRMADLQVRVIDAAGKPVAGAVVAVRQQSRAFSIGSFAQGNVLTESSSDGERTRAIFTRLFNRGTCPLYWADWGWPTHRDEYLAIGRWMHEHGLQVRGHVLVYPNFQYLPTELAAMKSDPTQLRQRILQQIREVAEATRGLGFREYDVTNELRSCTDLTNLLGREAVVEWYAEARRLLPGSRMALNENTILSAGGATVANQDNYLDWYHFLKSRGQAPDVLGFQGHFDENFTGVEEVWKIIDRFATETSAELQITEFDINTLNEQAQAAYTRDFLTACFAHPKISAFTMWGFWEGAHWLPRAAAWRKDWTPKPNAMVLEQLLTKEWWTDTTATTNADGVASVHAFLGCHRLSVRIGGKEVAAEAVLDAAGSTVTSILQSGR